MMSDQADHCTGFRIHGRVQGVGFRWWTHRTAERLGIRGSVRNLVDGSVEVRAAGPPAAMQEFEQLLHGGSRAASVDRVDRFSIAGISGDGFHIQA